MGSTGSTAPTPTPSWIDGLLEATVVGSFTKIGPIIRSRSEHWAPIEATPGRVVVVTGATSGLGREAAIELGALGCEVVCVGRNQQRLEEVGHEVVAAGGVAHLEQADLSDLEQTRALGERLLASLDHLDVLVHNAGALLANRSVTPQGHELTVTVHVLSPFLLTSMLRPILDAADHAKVIMMTSGGMYTEPFDLSTLEMDEASYKGSVAYARAKRAQVVLVDALQRREPTDGRTFAAVHPGWAKTPGVADSLPTFNKVLGPLLRSPREGVDTLVWLATRPPGQPIGGKLWLDRQPRSPFKLGRTRVDADTLRQQGDALLSWIEAQTGASV